MRRWVCDTRGPTPVTEPTRSRRPGLRRTRAVRSPPHDRPGRLPVAVRLPLPGPRQRGPELPRGLPLGPRPRLQPPVRGARPGRSEVRLPGRAGRRRGLVRLRPVVDERVLRRREPLPVPGGYRRRPPGRSGARAERHPRRPGADAGRARLRGRRAGLPLGTPAHRHLDRPPGGRKAHRRQAEGPAALLPREGRDHRPARPRRPRNRRPEAARGRGPADRRRAGGRNAPPRQDPGTEPHPAPRRGGGRGRGARGRSEEGKGKPEPAGPDREP
jgi:hypothetical protein